MRNVMWDYIEEEVSALKQLLNSQKIKEVADQVKVRKYKNILFVASGSSNNICRASKEFIETYTDFNVFVYLPFEFENELKMLQKFVVTETLVIGISQTGTSSSTLKCLTKAKKLGYELLTITERTDTPIQKLGDYYLNFECGLEACNAKTKGYSNSLMLLHIFFLELGVHNKKVDINTYQEIKNELVKIVEFVPNLIQDTKQWIEQHKQWSNAESIMVIGHSSNYATAMEGALKLSETLCVPANYADVDEYQHGFHRILYSNSYVILIEGNGIGSDAIGKTFEYIRKVTPNCLIISSKGNLSTDTINVLDTHLVSTALLSVIVFQILAVALPENKGMDPNMERHETYLEHLKTRVELKFS